MSGFTPVYGWPFQGRKDAPHGPNLSELLALAIEATVQSQLAALTARLGVLPVVSLAAQNALTGLFDGFTIWRTDLDALVVYDGTGWRYFRRPSTATVATSENTASAPYVDLATVGPSVSLETGTAALVTWTCFVTNATATATNRMGIAVSGATTIAAADASALNQISGGRASQSKLFTGLNPGTNTFTAKYGTSAGTASFLQRDITVEAR